MIKEFIYPLPETYNKVFTYGGKTIRLDIIDMSSAREYEVFRSKMYPKTDVFVFCYDVTSPSSASSISELWLPEVDGTTPSPHYIVVGCKSDLDEKKEALKQAKAAAKLLKCESLTCSAMTRKNVKRVFEEIIKSANSGSCVIM